MSDGMWAAEASSCTNCSAGLYSTGTGDDEHLATLEGLAFLHLHQSLAGVEWGQLTSRSAWVGRDGEHIYLQYVRDGDVLCSR